MNEEAIIIDMTDDCNHLNNLTVLEEDIRRFFWHLLDWSMQGRSILRVRQSRQDLRTPAWSRSTRYSQF